MRDWEIVGWTDTAKGALYCADCADGEAGEEPVFAGSAEVGMQCDGCAEYLAGCEPEPPSAFEQAFEVMNVGALVGVTPRDDDAHRWMIEALDSGGWQWQGRTLWVDGRFFQGIVDAYNGEGEE